MKIIDEKLLKQYRTPGNCEYCNRYCPSREGHHVTCRGMGGGRRLDIDINLLALGSYPYCNCHMDYHEGHIDKFSMEAKLAERRGLMQDDIRAVIRALLSLPKRPMPFEVDRVLAELDGNQKKIIAPILEKHL